MACHALKIQASPEPGDPAGKTRVERTAAVKVVFGEVLTAQSCSATDIQEDKETGVPAHVLAIHRVSLALPLEDVLDAVAAQLADRAWWRVSYHLCRNDEFQPCAPWQMARQFGKVPATLSLG